MQFIDLHAQRARIETEINTAIARVLEHGMFVMGPEVKAFEAELADFSKAKHALGCANGTDALAPAPPNGLPAGAAPPPPAPAISFYTRRMCIKSFLLKMRLI